MLPICCTDLMFVLAAIAEGLCCLASGGWSLKSMLDSCASTVASAMADRIVLLGQSYGPPSTFFGEATQVVLRSEVPQHSLLELRVLFNHVQHGWLLGGSCIDMHPDLSRYTAGFDHGTWLWIKNGYPTWNPCKWNHGPKPAVQFLVV